MLLFNGVCANVSLVPRVVSGAYTSQNDTVDRIELLQLPKDETAVALEALTLVNDQDLPTGCRLEHGRELLRVGDRLVRGHQHIVLRARRTLLDVRVEQLILADNVTGLRFSVERDNTEAWCPTLELAHPVRDRRVGYHN